MPSEQRWLVAGASLTVGLAVIDLMTGTSPNFTSIYFVGALVAASQAPVRPTAAVAVLAVSLTAVVGWLIGLDAPTWSARLALAIGGAGIALLVAVQRVRREQRFTNVQRVADAAQRAILASIPSQVGAIAFATRYLAADSEARIGGDLYEVVRCHHGVRVLVGDVCGHGLEAIRLTAVTLGAFREAAITLDSLTDVAATVDRRVLPHLSDETYVTAVLGDFDGDGNLTLVNCGHPSPLVVRSDGTSHLAAPTDCTTPLGLAPQPRPDHMTLGPGDRVLFYTDGLIEGVTPAGRTLTIEAFAPALSGGTADEAVERVLAALNDQVRHLDDDLALLLAEYVHPQPVHVLLSARDQPDRT
jgi:serine phosphatase RsbU (regulator of sigma subunit)